MVYGGDAKELIPINEDTIWSGGPGQNVTEGIGPESFAKARKAIFAGDYQAEKSILPNNYHGSSAYEYFGKLEIDFGDEAETEEYERNLSLDSAVARVELTRRSPSRPAYFRRGRTEPSFPKGTTRSYTATRPRARVC